MTQIFQLYVFILAGFVGFIVIQRVPPLLHTPLMSATNAISGISLVGAIVAAGGQYGRFATILGFIAVVCAATNVTAGFLITDRMLAMFRGQRRATGEGRAGEGRPATGEGRLGEGQRASSEKQSAKGEAQKTEPAK